MPYHENIAAYWNVWHEYHTRYIRSGGLDPNINASWKIVSQTMDALLDGTVNIQFVDDQPTEELEIIGERGEN